MNKLTKQRLVIIPQIIPAYIYGRVRWNKWKREQRNRKQPLLDKYEKNYNRYFFDIVKDLRQGRYDPKNYLQPREEEQFTVRMKEYEEEDAE